MDRFQKGPQKGPQIFPIVGERPQSEAVNAAEELADF